MTYAELLDVSKVLYNIDLLKAAWSNAIAAIYLSRLQWLLIYVVDIYLLRRSI